MLRKHHRDDPDPLPRRRPHRAPSGPVPTLAQLRRQTPWLRLYCRNPSCRHAAPIAIVPLMIRWSPDESSDRLRACARCSRCGHKGASLQHPSWAGLDVGFEPFPAPETKTPPA